MKRGIGSVAVPLALALAVTGCKPATMPERVDPAAYDQFYLWAGVPPRPELARARTVYLLAAEVRRGGPSRLLPLRAAPRTAGPELWAVIRTERLDWDSALTDQVARLLGQWSAAGNRVAGLQVDFDAATRGLGDYAAFLAELRRRLPPRYRLSVTGLMDWSANADPAHLAALVGVVDEVVVQSYQGRQTIPGYERYVARLARVPVPHKVALVEGGKWREPATLRADPGFRGYVVFLLRQ